MKKDHDPVNHPSHYTNHPSGIECIRITRHMRFNLGNAIKYLWRADLKGGIEDLKKAVWYIQDEIKRLETAQRPTMTLKWEPPYGGGGGTGGGSTGEGLGSGSRV